MQLANVWGKVFFWEGDQDRDVKPTVMEMTKFIVLSTVAQLSSSSVE